MTEPEASRRNILVRGVDFRNQGAYLMMEAAFHEIRSRSDGAPVLENDTGTPGARRAIGALTLDEEVSAQEIHAVLDASGFRYSDAWSNFDLDHDVNQLRRFHELGVPVFFLPQAWGPFELTARPCSQAIAFGHLAFSRDAESTRYLRHLAGQMGLTTRIEAAPDFTCALPGAGHSYDEFIGAVPIMPNWNIFRRAPSIKARWTYINNLAKMAEAALHRGRRVFGLAHEGRTDRRVLLALRLRMGGLEIIDSLDGRQAKAVLRDVAYAVADRYHGAVSCLTQEVPVAAHSWSHKYRYLLEDFGQTQLLLDPYRSASLSRAGQIVDKLEELSEGGSSQIIAGASEYHRRTLEMWGKVSF